MNALVRLNNCRAPAYASHPDRLDELFAGFFRPIADSARSGVEPIRLDVSEDTGAYRVAASLPGVKKEDIHVSVDQNEVTISAEVKREAGTVEGERVLHSERFHGKTARVFTVEIGRAHV